MSPVNNEPPKFNYLIDQKHFEFQSSRENVIQNIWKIGGDNGWYHADWIWKLRGFVDLIFGGKGHRKHRDNASEIAIGDQIDSWSVVDVNKSSGLLVLVSHLKMPGRAWLSFKVGNDYLVQTVKFKPWGGIIGKSYWFLTKPFHNYVFHGMGKKIISN